MLRRLNAQPGRLTLRLACVAGVVVLATVLAFPRSASASIFLKKAILAMRMIDGYHERQYSYDGKGGAKLFREFWVKGEKSRIESDDRLDVNDEIRAWVYRKDLRQAITFKVGPDYTKFLSGDLSLASILERKTNVGKPDVDVDENAEFEGQPAVRVTIDNYRNRQVLFFDRDALIPLRIDLYVEEDGDWKPAGYILADYPPSFPPNTFKFEKPAGVTLNDTDTMNPGAADRLVKELCSRP